MSSQHCWSWSRVPPSNLREKSVWWIVMHVNICQFILGVAILWYQWMVVQKTKKVIWCDSWYFFVKGLDGSHVIRFGLIRFYLHYWFNFWFGCLCFLLNMFLALILSRRFSKYVVSEEIRISCSMIFDEYLVFVSLSTMVSSERWSVSYLRLTSS